MASTVETSGTEVAKGNHVVPKGVAVEELDGGKNKLSKECPDDLQALLEKNDAKSIYDKFVQSIVDESTTRDVFGNWKDMEFDSILDQFRPDFEEKNIKVALCKRKSGSGTYRWIEFIDTEEVDNYVPQFDVSNMSGQVIKTCYTKIEFPNGVAVEKLKRWGKASKVRDRLKNECPIYVEKMMQEKDLVDEYNELIDALCNTDKTFWKMNWKVEELQPVVNEHKDKFEKKGVALFLSHKQEYISHGQHGGHWEYFRWIEFVDREKQPNYHPQRDAASKGEKGGCVVM
eukprot:CAMPEP_0185723390 /NCGR_PEP_ID=MMETSP1171-20130828/252_1 /TAXON_ID=374046 /ORGANISM="Helicotheca tamensis, Strain CCMP826" /LENGTH=286 /DNA_ID=CAMNT_0028391089 /DNA_START=58 /DNA_END=918 /DNA_ORIENTATION=+